MVQRPLRSRCQRCRLLRLSHRSAAYRAPMSTPSRLNTRGRQPGRQAGAAAGLPPMRRFRRTLATALLPPLCAWGDINRTNVEQIQRIQLPRGPSSVPPITRPQRRGSRTGFGSNSGRKATAIWDIDTGIAVNLVDQSNRVCIHGYRMPMSDRRNSVSTIWSTNLRNAVKKPRCSTDLPVCRSPTAGSWSILP